MKIITDSSSDLMPELIEKFGIDLVIPMKLSVDGKEYLDKVDLTNEQFYKEVLPGCTELPKTSQTTVNDFMEIYRCFPDEDLLVFPLSSGLSGSYNSACVAKEMAERDNVYVVDNKATSLALALMLEIASRKRVEGLSAAQIKEEIEALTPRLRVYAPVETLHYLVMGGRLSKVAGFVGSALQLKPIICLKDGVLTAVGKARGTRGVTKLLRELVDHDPIDFYYPIYFAHGDNPEGIAQVREIFPEVSPDAYTVPVGPIIGTHVGPGVTAISYIAQETI